MGNRTAKFISALVGSVIAGVPLAAVSQNAPSAPAASAANAAGDCLATPKGTAAKGQHWFYRVERGTKRQCWYLRAEGAKEGAKVSQTAQTTTDAPGATATAPQSVQNAHAEYVLPQTTAATSASPPAAASTQQATGTADANATQPAVATRWPDATPPASPAPQPAAAATTAPAVASPEPGTSPAPVTLAAADAPAEKPTGSLQMLLLVVGGALALAGLLASVIYRFAGGRARAQTADRRVNWDSRQDDDDDSRAPWHTEQAPRAERPLPVDFDAMRPQPPRVAAFADAIGRIASQGRPMNVAATAPDEAETEFFDDEFEIETPAPQLAASEDQAPDNHDVDDDESRAPLPAAPAPAYRAERPLRVDFDAVRLEAPQIAAFTDEIRRIALQGRPAMVAQFEPQAEPEETEIVYFDGEFELEGPAPQLAADDTHHEEPAEHDVNAQDEQLRSEPAVDIDIITAMLERLASEGPRLAQPAPEADLASLEADLAALARSSRGRSAARA